MARTATSADGTYKNREEVVAGITSTLILLMPDGEEIKLDDNRAQAVLEDHPALANLVALLTKKNKPRSPVASAKIMQRLEWAGYESASESGHLRYYPKGVT